jgi:hypothetical protein
MKRREIKLAIVLASFGLCVIAAFVQRALELRRIQAKPAELYEVVSRQVNAFRDADYSRAYQQVSMHLQERFNVEAFGDYARREYPEISRADRVEFGPVRFGGRHAFVQVYLFTSSGEVVPCIYSLIYEDHGWKIDGARIEKRWPRGSRLGGMRS